MHYKKRPMERARAERRMGDLFTSFLCLDDSRLDKISHIFEDVLVLKNTLLLHIIRVSRDAHTFVRGSDRGRD